MSVRTSIGIGIVVLAVPGLSACAGDKPAPAAASTTTATVTSPSAQTAQTTSRQSAPTTTTTTTATTATATTSTSTAPMVGGMTECTKSALAEPATQAAQALGPDNLYTVDDLSCADGWAVTSGVLASKANPQMGAPTSFVFEQQGQFWIPKEKAAVCGTNPTGTTPPDDAAIPAALFLAGCAAG